VNSACRLCAGAARPGISRRGRWLAVKEAVDKPRRSAASTASRLSSISPWYRSARNHLLQRVATTRGGRRPARARHLLGPVRATIRIRLCRCVAPAGTQGGRGGIGPLQVSRTSSRGFFSASAITKPCIARTPGSDPAEPLSLSPGPDCCASFSSIASQPRCSRHLRRLHRQPAPGHEQPTRSGAISTRSERTAHQLAQPAGVLRLMVRASDEASSPVSSRPSTSRKGR